MKIFTNITRGGQLFLHSLRMFKQVFNALLLCSCVLGAGGFGFKLYATITRLEAIGFADYYIAELMLALGLKHKKLNVLKYGRVTPVTCLQLAYFQDLKKRVEVKLANGILFGYNIGFLSFVLLSVIFIARGLKQSGERFSRGGRLDSFERVKKLIDAHNKKSTSGFVTYIPYEIARMPYLRDAEMEHTIVIGTTGAGKTVLISDLVDQIRRKGDRAIIYDKKCDYVKWFYDSKKDFILNPFDTRSEKWNLIKEIENVAHIKSITESFVPDKHTYGEKIWDEAARLAFSGILEKLICTGQDITNEKIVDLLLRQDMEAIAELVKGTYAQGTIDPNSPKTAASVIFTLATYFSSLRLMRGSSDESFSIKKWVAESSDSILFISSQESFSSELAPLQTAWFEIAITGILSQGGSPQTNSKKTWVILDELPTLQKIPSLAKGLSVSRSYGGCFVIGAQNIAQMREVYGRNMVESISSECNTRALFKTNDPNTANWVSNNVGETETLEYKEGLSYGAHNMRDGVNVHSQEKLKALILPAEIQNMPKLTLLLKTAGFGTVRAKINYKAREVRSEPFIHDNTITEHIRKAYESCMSEPSVSKNLENVDSKPTNVF